MSTVQLSDRLAALRASFLKELRDNRRALTDLLQRAEQTDLTGDARRHLLALTHSLAGRGGTFGFPSLSDAAVEVHHLLETNTRGLSAAAPALIRAVERILDPPHSAEETREQ